MSGPDKTGGHDLLQTIDALSSEFPAERDPAVSLTEEDAGRLISAIQRLGRSNLRLVDEFRGAKKLIKVCITLIAVMLLLLAVLLWLQLTATTEIAVLLLQ